MKGDENHVDNTKELTHLSLCAGYGGIDLGLTRTLRSVRTVCFVEIESFVIKNLVSKIESGLLSTAPIFTDLKRFPWELFSRKVDILSGGFPCQPFSSAGKRAGSEDPRHLWPHIVEGIKRLDRPPLVFFENVEGIISSKLKGNNWADPEGTSVLLHVLRELERLGYKATASLFSASEVGAPHQRKRVFILGVRNELGQSGIDFINGLLQSTNGTLENADDFRRRSREESDHKKRRALERTGQSVQSKRNIQADVSKLSSGSYRSTAYPAPRGQRQYWYEPPRVTTGYTNDRGNESNGVEHRVLHSKTECREASGLERTDDLKGLSRQTESTLGRNAHGASDWLDYAKLYESCDNRTDELRMLGNGVVPQTASRAFVVLWNRLTTEKPCLGDYK